MHFSVMMLPVPILGFGLLKRTIGPYKTLDLSDRMADWICARIQKYSGSQHHFLPGDLDWEISLLHHIVPVTWGMCFETACAFQQWLAFHGEHSEVRIGKRVEGGSLYMHAWVETESANFLYDSRFSVVFG